MHRRVDVMAAGGYRGAPALTRPVVAATYPLADIAKAQQDFLAKHHTGNLVLVPPTA